MSALSRVFDYFYSYDTDTFEVFSCQGVEPTEADVEGFDASAGFRLPSEFRPRPEVLDVGPFWSFSYGLKVYGLSDEIPEWLSLEHELEEFRRGGGRDDLVPFLSAVGDANRYCRFGIGPTTTRTARRSSSRPLSACFSTRSESSRHGSPASWRNGEIWSAAWIRRW